MQDLITVEEVEYAGQVEKIAALEAENGRMRAFITNLTRFPPSTGKYSLLRCGVCGKGARLAENIKHTETCIIGRALQREE